MSKLHRLQHELATLEREGLITIANGMMTISRDDDIVKHRIMMTGPWGALLLMGKLDEVMATVLPEE